MPSIQFGTDVISYQINYSAKRKNLSIQVDENGVTVIAPKTASEEEIQSILKQKVIWILKQQAYFSEIEHYENPRKFLSGEKLPYLGRQYRLKVHQEAIEKASFIYRQGRFIAYVPNHLPEDEYRNTLYPLYKEWIIQRGSLIAAERIKRFQQFYPYSPKKVIIKDQQQRWGSCTANEQVLLNWHIFLAPMSAIDYVIAHELAHLKVMDHSNAFWETLAMVYPEYQVSKEWLRLNGRKLYI
ncbi:hypothetical protein SAMN05880501_11346 [Ureibacillus xyleni]|uniref:YgjP-like metallopeptidase domain-containing protein n=1 Tax=Ureibacillus xyleni TaxID=614648 RepID=A0A285TI12_9BACL|nr:SprT family zinc-dependent metalloprotease [Ureibacillus xyleni]SOC21700.1 hypothetical protein SAMN05880501_11346 [Ureibacillus xyleni]